MIIRHIASFRSLRGILMTVLCGMMLTGCSLYQKYDATPEVADNIMGDIVQPGDSVSLGAIGWREIFTDPLLQKLIETALANNTDVKMAELTIEQAQNDLASVRLGNLPTLSFEPTGGMKRFNSASSYYYNIPLRATWQPGIFGQNTSKKRQAEAQRALYVDYKKGVMTDLSANVAITYYSLVMLDRELEILLQTEKVWEESLESMRTLYEAGLYQSPAVYRMEASLASVRSGIAEKREDILSTESALCLLLSESPHHIERAPFGTFKMPEVLHVGVPLQLLSARSDVRRATRNMEIAFYATQQARQAFFPDITIRGDIGWSNDNGLVNPGQFLAEAVGSLLQPLFAQGKIRARHKNALLDQEKARLQFVQTLLNAGNEVYRYLHECRKSEQKAGYISTCVSALTESYEATRELMNNGTNTYLEVLTAQEDLLTSQLTEVQNRYDGIQSLINLYNALGGF